MKNKPTERYIQVWEIILNGKFSGQRFRVNYPCSYQEALKKVCSYVQSLPKPLPQEYFRPLGTVIIKKLVS